MCIRVMTIDDYDDVCRLWMRTPGMGLNSLDDSREGIETYLERNPRTCFVAVKKNRVVGVILCGHDGRRGYIYHTAVDVSERCKGIARKLLESSLSALEQEGINKTALVVFSRNTEGNRFWDKCGFTVRNDLIYRNKVIKESIRMDT